MSFNIMPDIEELIEIGLDGNLERIVYLVIKTSGIV